MQDASHPSIPLLCRCLQNHISQGMQPGGVKGGKQQHSRDAPVINAASSRKQQANAETASICRQQGAASVPAARNGAKRGTAATTAHASNAPTKASSSGRTARAASPSDATAPKAASAKPQAPVNVEASHRAGAGAISEPPYHRQGSRRGRAAAEQASAPDCGSGDGSRPQHGWAARCLAPIQFFLLLPRQSACDVLCCISVGPGSRCMDATGYMHFCAVWVIEGIRDLLWHGGVAPCMWLLAGAMQTARSRLLADMLAGIPGRL